MVPVLELVMIKTLELIQSKFCFENEAKTDTSCITSTSTRPLPGLCPARQMCSALPPGETSAQPGTDINTTICTSTGIRISFGIFKMLIPIYLKEKH